MSVKTGGGVSSAILRCEQVGKALLLRISFAVGYALKLRLSPICKARDIKRTVMATNYLGSVSVHRPLSTLFSSSYRPGGGAEQAKIVFDVDAHLGKKKVGASALRG